MKRRILAAALLLLLASTGAAATPDLKRLLPPGAEVVVTQEADLTGDGRPELILGYMLPRQGLPPTLGRAAVFEGDRAGTLRRIDLAGSWPGHYPPKFTVIDLTGDGRPELVEQVGGGVAWGTLRVFRRATESYELLLEDAAMAHVLWDADGDGRPDVIARKRIRSQQDQALQRFLWRDGRFIAWHAPEWSYTTSKSAPAPTMPNLTGLTVKEADMALSRAGFNLGVLAALDRPGPAGRIIRYAQDGGQVHVAFPAGDTSVSLPALPPVSGVQYFSGREPGAAPIAGTESQRARWRDWLSQLAARARQAVYTGGLSTYSREPVYIVELQAPWSVKLGGREQTVRWVGVGTGVPFQGLLFLASERVRPGYQWAKFKAAVFTALPVAPPPVEPERPLAAYLKTHPELDAFITVWPAEWTNAVRLRGIAPQGWPAPDFAPHLEGPSTPDPAMSPEPDHLVVTVLHGFVRRAVRRGDEIDVEVVKAPGRAYRWLLPLTGFNHSTQMVRVRLSLPGQAPVTREVPLEAWRDWSGDPGPGSLSVE